MIQGITALVVGHSSAVAWALDAASVALLAGLLVYAVVASRRR